MARLTFPRVAVFAAIACSVLLVAPPALAAPGDLDQSFGIGGIVTTAVNDAAFATGVGLEPNGDVVAAGTESSSSQEGIAVVEYTSTGKPDHQFGGGDGIATASFGSCAEASGMTIDSQGRIVVVGLRKGCNGHAEGVAIARFRPNGSLDPTFGGGSGKEVFVLAGAGEEGESVAMDGNKIVVAGQVEPRGSSSTVFLFLRLHGDGSLDHTFSNDGFAFVRVGQSNSGARAVAIASNHRIVACGFEDTGSGGNDFAVVRLLSSGSPDTGFSSDGTAAVGFSPGLDECFAVAMDSGKVVLGGVEGASATSDVAVARLRSDGHLDASFATGGRTTLSLSSGFDTATGVAVGGTGRIVVSAAKNGLGNARYAVLRYTGNGQLDQSFGNLGVTTTKINSYAFPNGVALGGGTIVLAGDTMNGNNKKEFAVARYKS
jgi:uncharacterized delta-60 repeat protein